ncbi:PDZ domain-containing protein [Rubinisphaera margarita]|uniref:PDZ domain-containing protein n=1 Tax=Rubinisphaera margarita TaxID=2909586 RepID=UPI001EE9770A|nr:PDZ domain-containing protein [Rubinisphaera margarita]MCG6157651.1 PDZ domain-containing protein [Rubinisphaera margarita]
MTLSNAAKLFVAVAAISFSAVSVQAGERLYLVKPDVDHHHHDDVPKLGFYGKQTCYGMVVKGVVKGSEAWRIGLEEGDVIVSIDGYHLHDSGDYERALRRAGHHADLRVKDVRGRGIFTIHADLDRCRGEIKYYSYRD